MEQILNSFEDEISPDILKFICAPCSNCKGQLRDAIRYYELEERANIHYTGLVEFIVNAMVDTPMRYIEETEEGEAVPAQIPAEVQSIQRE